MLDIASITTNAGQLQEFPNWNKKVYFNFGGQGMLPRSGLEAMIEAYNYLQQQGPFSGRANDWINRKTELLRQNMAQALGVEPQTLSITENVTVGCDIVLWGIPWRRGDHILLTDCEHPGIIATAQEICRRFDVEMSTCPIRDTLNGGDPVTIIAEHLRPNTRLLIVSHVLWNTGQVLPLREICRVCHGSALTDRPVLTLVDAAQSVGCLALDLKELEVDFYAFTGHKWWCGPAGVGGLYVRPEAFDEVRPTFIGWRGIDMDEDGQPTNFKGDGRRFEVATSAYAQYEGLRAALGVHEEWGSARQRFDRILQLTGYLWQGLNLIEGVKCLKNSPPAAGLVSFRVEGANPHKFVQELEEKGFLLRSIRDPLCVRACVHYFTLPAQIEQLVDTVRQLRSGA